MKPTHDSSCEVIYQKTGIKLTDNDRIESYQSQMNLFWFIRVYREWNEYGSECAVEIQWVFCFGLSTKAKVKLYVVDLKLEK